MGILQQRKESGETLTKHEESSIRRKAEFDMAPAMVRLRAGAVRLTLSFDEEKEVRRIERELRDIAALQQQKADGEYLNKAQEAKIGRKAEFEKAPVMVKVKFGALRPLGKAKAIAPAASEAARHTPEKEKALAADPSPVSASAPDSPSLPMPARLAPMGMAPTPALLAQLG